jgi:hypothetical protein
MATDSEAFQAIFVEDVPTAWDVSIVAEGFINFKVVAPAGDLDTIVTKGFGFGAQVVEGKVGPLAGEEGNRTGHRETPFGEMGMSGT